MSRDRAILQVSTHTTLRPIHGGQIRSRQIGRALEQAGYVVHGIATCWRQDHEISNDREFILDIGKAREWNGGAAGGLFGDYFLSATVDQDAVLREEFFRRARLARPAAVLLEHPWMWPLARQIPEVAAGAPVIYDSQNVEAHLKTTILQDLKLNPRERAEADALLPVVDAFERGVATGVDAVTACTRADAAIFDAWGARRTVVAGNGSARRPVTGLRGLYPSLLPANCRYAFMVGSEHHPNVSGFENLVLPWIASLRPGQRVVVAGGVCGSLRRRFDEWGISAALDGRVVLLGHVSELALSALIEQAACIIVPIEYGGGSNLKTAEALLSDRRIVASPAAMRGFDAYQALPGVAVADGPEAFGVAVRRALADGSAAPRDAACVAGLTWDAMLGPLVALVGELIDLNRRGAAADG